MTKAEFITMRQAQRDAGLIKEYVEPERKFELTEDEEARMIARLGNQKSAVFRTAEVGATGLLTTEVYEGRTIKARRARVDEIDNVTVWRS